MQVLLSGSPVEKMRLGDCQECSQLGLKWRKVLVSLLNPDPLPYLHHGLEIGLGLGCLREGFLWLLVLRAPRDQRPPLGVISGWVGELRDLLCQCPPAHSFSILFPLLRYPWPSLPSRSPFSIIWRDRKSHWGRQSWRLCEQGIFLNTELNSYISYFREGFPNNELWRWLAFKTQRFSHSSFLPEDHTCTWDHFGFSISPCGDKCSFPWLKTGAWQRWRHHDIYHWSHPWDQIQLSAEK